MWFWVILGNRLKVECKSIRQKFFHKKVPKSLDFGTFYKFK